MVKPLVLFDLDGTLIKAGGAGARAMSIAFRQLFGRENAFARVSFTGMTDPAILGQAFQQVFSRPPDKDEATAFFNLYLEVLKDQVAHAEHYRVLPGIRQLLQELADKRVPFGLATGNLMEGARIKLERAGLWNLFPFGGFGSDSINRTRLTRIAIQRAEEATGRHFPAKLVWVVGDSPAEHGVARRIHARVALVATGWTRAEELRALRPDLCFKDLGDWQGVVDAFING